MSRLEREVPGITTRSEMCKYYKERHKAYADGLLFLQSATLGDDPKYLPLEYRQVFQWAHLCARLRNRGFQGVDKYTWLDIVRTRRVPRKLEFKVLEEHGLLKLINLDQPFDF